MLYKLRIEQDTDLDGLSPRDWDNMGHMVCWHSRYNLGDEQRRDDVNEWLRELACSLDPSLEERLLHWEDGDGWTRLVNQAYKAVATGNPGPLPHVLSENKVRDLVMAVIDKHTVMLPLYLYDHGGITMNTGGYSCPWDSGQVGYIYATRDTILKEFSAKKLTAKLRRQVEDILRSEVKTYAQYLEGDVYGYVIYKIDEPCDCDPEPWYNYPPCDCTKHAEVVDSCWGFYGSDVALEEGRSILKYLEDKDKEKDNV